VTVTAVPARRVCWGERETDRSQAALAGAAPAARETALDEPRRERHQAAEEGALEPGDRPPSAHAAPRMPLSFSDVA